MAYALKWDEVGSRTYETGTRMGVLFPQKVDGTYDKGVAWSGLTGVDENPSGADATDLWADDIKYLSIRSAEEFGYTVKAYSYPREFGQCDGTAEPAPGMTIYQQTRRGFGFCYRSTVGNDGAYNDYGYKLHIIYGSTASPSARSMSTINDSPSAVEFSWECKTTPVDIPGFKPSAEIVLDSTVIPAEKMAAIESIIYGTEGGADPRLPMPAEIITILNGSIADATPTGITIASAVLTPAFDASIRAYSAVASASTGAITVTAASGATIGITVNGTAFDNEDTAEWAEGNNTVVITVSASGKTTTTTTITVVYTA